MLTLRYMRQQAVTDGAKHMVAAKPILAAILALGVGYVAYPYATLYRLDRAIHRGDATALQTLVDWPSVREGIKEDICDSIGNDPAQKVSDGELPAFGASFVRGVTANAVDQQVTPQRLAALAHSDVDRAGPRGADTQVSKAFFTGPTDFEVSLRVPGQPGPIRLRMTLQDADWRVTRIWLPPHLLQEANAGT